MEALALKGARQRRFESLPQPAPELVRELSDDHPAIIGQSPMFPGQVILASEAQNLFVSGVNNRKIGRVITKGAWAGLPIYMLTLPERATCPTACHNYKTCYGNAMHMAKRIAPGKELEARIPVELDRLEQKHPNGFVARLHVLGDFYSVDYVRLWRRMLQEHNRLHIYGYSARGMMRGGSIADKLDADIAEEITNLGRQFAARVAIRWSRPKAEPGAAVVLDAMPATVKPGSVICPAETESTACCATCGLCWDPRAQSRTILFLRHGYGSSKNGAIAQAVAKTADDGLRQIEPIAELAKLARKPMGKPPILLWVNPRQIYVEEADYQREISRAGVKNVADIVRNFDWRVLEPPLCVRHGDDKFKCIDGQHGAIAAASHPGVEQIPILLVEAESLTERAILYIRKNWSRRRPTDLQRHKAEITANDPLATAISTATAAAGVRVLAAPAPQGKYHPGDTMALGSLRKVQRIYGTVHLTDVLKLIAHHAPLRAPTIEGVATLKWSMDYKGRISDEQIRRAVDGDYEELMAQAKAHAKQFGIKTADAIAAIYFQYGTGE